MIHTPPGARRHFLRHFLRHTARLAAAGSLVAPPAVRADSAGARALAMVHTHTGEQIDLVYARAGRYVPPALGTLNHFLRDHRTGDVGLIDPALFDLLHRLRQMFDTGAAFEVISGYRCARTNAHLRESRGGGVAARSLHMEGRAIDVRLSGVPLAALRDAALSLRAGGVGYYPHDRFVHLDTGRLRHW